MIERFKQRNPQGNQLEMIQLLWRGRNNGGKEWLYMRMDVIYDGFLFYCRCYSDFQHNKNSNGAILSIFTRKTNAPNVHSVSNPPQLNVVPQSMLSKNKWNSILSFKASEMLDNNPKPYNKKKYIEPTSKSSIS